MHIYKYHLTSVTLSLSLSSEAQAHDNPVFLGDSPQPKPRTVSQIMRQSSETGHHLLSDPGTPFSPNIQGELMFFSAQGTTHRHIWNCNPAPNILLKLVTATHVSRNIWKTTTQIQTRQWCLNIANLKQMHTHHTNRNSFSWIFSSSWKAQAVPTRFQWKMNTRMQFCTQPESRVCRWTLWSPAHSRYRHTPSSPLTFSSAEFTKCQFPLFSLISQHSFLLLWWQAGFWETCVCMRVYFHVCFFIIHDLLAHYRQFCVPT